MKPRRPGAWQRLLRAPAWVLAGVCLVVAFSPSAFADLWYESYANAEEELAGENWREAIEQLAADGIRANQLAIRWIVPFHVERVSTILGAAKRTIVVENNHSGQFFRYMRSETGFTPNGHIRKYDGEPFMPHHIADGVREQLAGKTDHYVPDQEIMV